VLATLNRAFDHLAAWSAGVAGAPATFTFLMVFLIQNTQNRDTRALHLKLDELLRALPDAREAEFMDLEERDEKELEAERKKLFAECAVCSSPQEHARHTGVNGSQVRQRPDRTSASKGGVGVG
jgi:low affinity Fe/Cu permease